MGAAFLGINAVGKGGHVLRVAVVVLYSDLDGGAVYPAGDIDGFIEHLPVLVYAPHQAGDATLEEIVGLAVRALVPEADLDTFIKECKLTKAFSQVVEIIADLLEYLGIGHERNGGSCMVGPSHGLHVRLADAGLVILPPDLAVSAHLGPHPGGKGADHRCADTVQAGGDAVCPVAELAAGMQGCHHHLQGRDALFGMYINRYSPAVV